MAKVIEHTGAGDGFLFVARFPVGADIVAEISGLCADLSEFLGKKGLPLIMENGLCIAVEELLTNLSKYAGAGEAGGDTLTAEGRIDLADKGRPRFWIRDDGAPFDPRTAPKPSLSDDPLERAVGGLGLHMLFQMFELRYVHEDGRNVSEWVWIDRGGNGAP